MGRLGKAQKNDQFVKFVSAFNPGQSQSKVVLMVNDKKKFNRSDEN